MRAVEIPRNGRVTVVIPTYNRAALLPRAIETALAQTAADRCDIVVVDDGSRDDTPAVARRYAERIVYVHRSNGGLGAARNTALRTRLNEYAALLDDDDLWRPDKIEKQLAALARWPQAVLVAGRSVNRYPDGREELRAVPAIPMDRPVDLAPLLFEETFLPPSSVMVRMQTLHDVGLFHTRVRGVEDYHMWAKLACRGPFVHLDAPVAVYFVGTPGAYSNDSPGMQTRLLRARYLLQPQLRERPDCRAAWQRGVVRNCADLRDVSYRRGRYGAAARYGFRALLHEPWGRARWEWTRALEALARVAAGAGGSRGTTPRAARANRRSCTRAGG